MARNRLVLTPHERELVKDTWPLELITDPARQPLEVRTPTEHDGRAESTPRRASRGDS